MSTTNNSMFERLMAEKEARKNSSNLTSTINYAKNISKKIEEYVTNNFYTNKQVHELHNLIKDIFLNSHVNEMRTIGSHLNLPIVADLQKDDYKIIQLPAINNVKRRKMQNPKCEAYAINFKNDIQKYITKFNFSFKNFIGIILYADDITVSQPLGPFRRNNSFTHVAYRLSNAIELTSSELIHFRTYGVAQTKFAKFDHYQTLIRETIMDINTTEIKTQHGIMKVKVELVIGDNQFMHYLFKTPLIFTNRGRNNCRCCTISGTDWHKYKTAQSILPHVRKQHKISFLPENNHLNMDGFHDIIGGCLNYFLSGSISIFLKLLKNNFTEQQLINAILNNAFEFDKENELRTLLRPGFFKINKKDHFKNKTNVSGSECLLIAHCFWIILKEQINETQNESIKHKFKEIEILIKACLNLGYAINDYKLDIEECAVIFEKNAKAVYETMFLLFGRNFSISTKIHNLLHYPYAIRKLQKLPCMFNTIRFESSNRRVKNFIRNSMCRINPAKSIIKKLIFLDNLNADYTISNATTNIRIREKWNYEIDDNALSEEFNVSEIINVTLNASAYLNDFIEANEVESESSESESDNDPLDFTYYP